MTITGMTTGPATGYPLQQMYYYGTNAQDVISLSSKVGDGAAFNALGGDDWVYGNWANNAVYGGDGDDHVGPGNDVLYGNEGSDFLFGDEGKDKLYGGADNDKLWGGADDDALYGGSGADQLQGGSENDYLSGGDGQDFLYGAEGSDHLVGGNDADVLWGGTGVDMLEGGAGADQFEFHLSDAGDVFIGQADKILDLDDTDTIWLQGEYSFAGDTLTPGYGEFSIWHSGDWVVSYNAGGDRHDIVVSSDPHGQIDFF